MPEKLLYETFFTSTKKLYVRETAAEYSSKIYFLKSAKKTSKPNNHDLNRDCINDLHCSF